MYYELRLYYRLNGNVCACVRSHSGKGEEFTRFNLNYEDCKEENILWFSPDSYTTGTKLTAGMHLNMGVYAPFWHR